MADAHVAVVSAGRSGNVPGMTALCAELDLTWYVPADQVGEYRYAGATDVVGSGGLCESRNAALDAAAGLGLPCIQLSDDLKRVAWTESKARTDVQPISVADACARLLDALEATGAQLAGCAPTENPYFYRQPIHRSAFIVGDFIAVAAGCPLRFSTELRLKEDYDYTCQHLAAYGLVARVDGVLAGFQHRTNKGGAVAYRDEATEQEAIAWLKARWPGVFKDNTRRPNEVLMRWKGPSTMPSGPGGAR